MEAHRDTLRAMAMRLTRNPSDADDLVQETFIRALERRDSLRNPKRMRSWLIRIMYNLFYDGRRGDKRAGVTTEIDAADVPISDSTKPTWTVLGASDVRAAVADLDSQFRVVTEQHALGGRSYEQIADDLDVPKATVGTRLLRARRKLKQGLSRLAGKRKSPRIAPRRLDRMR